MFVRESAFFHSDEQTRVAYENIIQLRMLFPIIVF